MARREGVYVHKRTRFESPPPPNQTIDVISVEIRVFFPPNAGIDDVGTTLAEALGEAILGIAARIGTPRPLKVWLSPPPTWEAPE